MPAGGGDERASRVFRKTRRYAAEVSNLGANVRALRQRRYWTLEHAAEQMHLDLKHLQKVEAGELNVTMVTLVRIAEGLGVPLAALFRAPRPKSPAK
jgi:transcriptional regulator with XRE-family HTH domain